jgi:Type II secretion system (T2SS), protein E, N-terminal domain
MLVLREAERDSGRWALSWVSRQAGAASSPEARLSSVAKLSRATGSAAFRHGSVTRKEYGACGNPQCSSGWMRAWKDRSRPIFEGRWGCSARCVKAMVERAMRREFVEIHPEVGIEDGLYRHRVPLGLVLLSQGWITSQQLQSALARQRRAGRGRIGHWLIEEWGLKEGCVTRALSVQWGCPVLPVQGFEPEKMALVLPRVLVERLGMVPLRIAGRRILYVGFEDRMDAAAAAAIERMSGLRVESGLVDGSRLKAMRERLFESEFVDAELDCVADAGAMMAKITCELRSTQPTASRLIRVHQFYWLRMWLESGAMRAQDGGVPVSKEDVVDRVYTIDAGRPSLQLSNRQ